jgi:hypothetical protein
LVICGTVRILYGNEAGGGVGVWFPKAHLIHFERKDKILSIQRRCCVLREVRHILT